MFTGQLTEILTAYNKTIANYDETVQKNIAALAEGAPVIITGQQPQLAGGTLLIIYKIVGLIYHAKKLQEQHAKRVVPVFWIAGEDHDIAEMDHIYVNTELSVDKVSLDWANLPIVSASEVYVSKQQVQLLISDIKKTLPDFTEKKRLIDLISSAYDGSSSLSISFANIVARIFTGSGVIFYDSHDSKARLLQIDFFEKIVDDAKLITDVLQASCNSSTQVKVKNNHTGLYYNYAARRRALFYEQTGDYYYFEKVTKKYSRAEIKEIINKHSNKISCNVLMRIINQQFMFCPAYYIGGANELKYWQQTDRLFTYFNYTKPHLFERKSFIILNNKAQNIIEQLANRLNSIDSVNSQHVSVENLHKLGVRKFLELLDNYIQNSILDSEEVQKHLLYFDQLKVAIYEHVNIDTELVCLNKQKKDKIWSKFNSIIEKEKSIVINDLKKSEKRLSKNYTWLSNELLPKNKEQERVGWALPYVFRDANLIDTIAKAYADDDLCLESNGKKVICLK